MGHLLVVHKNPEMRDLLARTLRPYWSVQSVADVDAVRSAVREKRPDMVLVGAGEEESLADLLRVILAEPLVADLPVMVMQQQGAHPLPEDLRSPTLATLPVPFTARELAARIDAQLRLAHVERSNAQREGALRQEAQAAKDLLEQVLASLNDHFVMFDHEWRYTYVNDAAAQVLGMTREQLLGNCIWELFPESVGNEFYRMVHRARSEGKDTSFEHYYAPWDRWYDNRVYALPAGVSVLTIDITERKRAEEALQNFNATLERLVAERTAELQRSNRELDQFAYIISHDLKAPLRAIYFLAEWIEEDAKDTLPPTSQEHFAKLRGRVRRMDKLLDDMLAYSRAGRQRHTPELVDTNALVQDIVDLLAPPQGFRVVMEQPLPVIDTERVPLETVLRNLISNAIKHHHDPANGFVQVSARKGSSDAGAGASDSAEGSAGSRWVEFTVADNGPGIEPAYHARIFEIFSTLRSRDEVEGSGMGLTVVQKIVETRGGRVWVESAGGKGATFRFTWPL